MAKAAVILLAGTDTHADMGRATNALETVEQLRALDPQARTAAPALNRPKARSAMEAMGATPSSKQHDAAC